MAPSFSFINLLLVSARIKDTNTVLHTLKDPTTFDAQITKEVQDATTSFRPFHQQWWPIATTNSLKKDRPNALQLLGKPLVAFWDKSAEQWKILEDMCSHRFAPLSEGRIVNGCSLQCAYHGWEFNGNGTCTKVPQTPTPDKARCVEAYPVREDIYLLWVWMDPLSYQSLGATIPLPVNPFLRSEVEKMGPAIGFQRDLPYGMELLGENLLDLSHLPFSHHSVGNLRRDLGGLLPTRMLSQEEQQNQTIWEYEHVENPYQHKPVLPVFQAEIINASQYDPATIAMARSLDTNTTSTWTTTIAYYEPSHVRYRRDRGENGGSHVELFFCPTAPGNSRVFLFNLFRLGQSSPLTPPPEPKTTSWLPSFQQSFKVSKWKSKASQALLKTIQTTQRVHLLSHKIFDGDGIFLHKQGHRMAQAHKSFRDYSTPSSADVALNNYRRVLEQAAEKTRHANLISMADSVVGSNHNAYSDTLDRAMLLDRYNTHTKHCPVCLGALRMARRRKSLYTILQPALYGAMGASSLALLILIGLLGFRSIAMRLFKRIFNAIALALIGCSIGSVVAGRRQQMLQTHINSFVFEDYVHADKN